MSRILVLEDELSIRGFIKMKLRKLGHEIIEAETGKEAIEKMENNIDIALLDVMLPDIDGFQVCENIRANYPRTGIIMLTAKGQEDDKIYGLGSGADDYIVKPFSPKELSARIDSLLRRVNLNMDKELHKRNIISSDPFILDMNKKIIYKNNQEISLTPTEYSILKYLITKSSITLSRNEILDEVWGENYVGDAKIVDVNISRIRQKIEDIPTEPIYLKSIWGRGYIWSQEK